jgi:hypothetical protein
LPALAQTGNICSFVPPPKPPQALWSDAEGWGKPEYVSTIRLADLDGDGRAELGEPHLAPGRRLARLERRRGLEPPRTLRLDPAR